jgi:hypothetical protein
MIIRMRLGVFDPGAQIAESAVVGSTAGDVAMKVVSVASHWFLPDAAVSAVTAEAPAARRRALTRR